MTQPLQELQNEKVNNAIINKYRLNGIAETENSRYSE